MGNYKLVVLLRLCPESASPFPDGRYLMNFTCSQILSTMGPFLSL
jgi:hypothetical protein